MIIAEVDVEKTLFLDVMGNTPRPELEPRLWRSAINTEPLFGRFFGFHYAPELRNFLSIVNIARGSISTAAATTADSSSPIIRNIAALGWGWVYSNMVILNNLGVSIDAASQIGADSTQTLHNIGQVRTFMNLVEDPVLSGVAALASADVALDHVFAIRCTSDVDPERDDVSHAGMTKIPVPSRPIPARVISYPERPIVRSQLTNSSSIEQHAAPPAIVAEAIVNEMSDSAGAQVVAPTVGDIQLSVDVPAIQIEDLALEEASRAPLDSLNGVKQAQDQAGAAPGLDFDSPRAGPRPSTLEISSRKRSESRAASLLPASTEKSKLASAIKKEFVKLHSNVSSFLAPHHAEPATALIVHFHGGGFISQSSGGHLVYLKEWAADVPDAVILSVDYRLAPENPYPAALDDCLYAYQWALENTTILGTKAERVVLCGDSAGGNLAVAVALKAQTYGLRAADGIALAYPALYVNVAWSPSRLLSFFDPLLPLSILDLCLRAYVPDGERPHDNPLISPLVAPSEALRALPPVAIIAGSLDPLLDDAVQFAHNLRQQGRTDVTLRVMESLPHGFLNMVQVSRQARAASSLLSGQMAAMLGVSQRPGLGIAEALDESAAGEGAEVVLGASGGHADLVPPVATLFNT